jgi:hypothetical protein
VIDRYLVRLGVLVAVATLLGACAADLFTPEAQPLPSPTAGDFRSEQTDKGTTFWPRSAPVEPGVEYRFNTGHCGLEYLTDFDGSFWRPMDPNGKAEDPLFFYNEDDGAMTLESKNVAVYESSDQQSVTLRRIPGSVTLKGLCA